MRIVVTGATGFVGSWVTQAALDRGHRVWATTRSAQPRITTGAHYASVNTPADVQHVLDEACPHAVVHLAWPVPPDSYRHSASNDEGLDAARMVFEASARARVPHVVGVGSCLELGTTEAVRTERTAPAPTCRYATTKNAARELGAALSAASGSRFSWARLFHLYGPGEHPGRLVRDALDSFRAGRPFVTSPGGQVRDWLHVASAADALVTLAESDHDGIAHVCGEAPGTLGELLTDLARICGTRDLLHVGDRPYGAAEVMKIVGRASSLRDLGWAPRIHRIAGLRHTVDAFRAGRWGPDAPQLPIRPVDFDLTRPAAEEAA